MQGKQTETEKGRILLEIQPFWPIFGVTTSCRKAVRETLRFPNSKPRATVVLLLMVVRVASLNAELVIFGLIRFRPQRPMQSLAEPAASQR